MKREPHKNFDKYLCLQRLATKTSKAYLQAVKGLSGYLQQPAERLTNDQIQEYLLYCIQEKKLAWSSCNVLFSGLKKFYHGFLGRDDTGFSIPPRPRSQQLPLLLSRDEVSRILQATNNLKHHALLAIVYGSGLRVSEAVKLRPEHIDSKKMLLRINQSKGRKDRYTILSKSSLEVCENCGTSRNCYNSCRNRHCPKCQTMAKEKWLEKRQSELLPCGYFHMVFTIPHCLIPAGVLSPDGRRWVPGNEDYIFLSPYR